MAVLRNSADAASVIVFGVFGVALGVILELILKNFAIPIPYTVLLFYLGVGISALLQGFHIHTFNFLELSGVSADLIVYGFLPTLLFSETMTLNW
jgi:hypothetical protein